MGSCLVSKREPGETGWPSDNLPSEDSVEPGDLRPPGETTPWPCHQSRRAQLAGPQGVLTGEPELRVSVRGRCQGSVSRGACSVHSWERSTRFSACSPASSSSRGSRSGMAMAGSPRDTVLALLRRAPCRFFAAPFLPGGTGSKVPVRIRSRSSYTVRGARVFGVAPQAAPGSTAARSLAALLSFDPRCGAEVGRDRGVAGLAVGGLGVV